MKHYKYSRYIANPEDPTKEPIFLPQIVDLR